MKHRRRWYAWIAMTLFTAGAATHQVFFSRAVGLSKWVSCHLLQTLSNATGILLCMLGIAAAHGGDARPLQELGLRSPIGRVLGFGLLATLPMSLGFAFMTGFAWHLEWRALLHVYQADSVPEVLGILAITGTGSALLCRVFIRWQDNLWAAFFVHAMMNLWWGAFAVDDTALGGWFANGAKLATALLGIVLSLFKDRLWPRLPVETANLDRVNLTDLCRAYPWTSSCTIH